MKKRTIFLLSLITAAIAQCLSITLIFKLWIPVVLPSYGMLITGIGVFVVPFVVYLVVFLLFCRLLGKTNNKECILYNKDVWYNHTSLSFLFYS